MISKSKLTLIAAIVAASITSPAFAQAFDPEVGTGNVQSFSYPASQNNQITAHDSGRNAYGMVGGRSAGTSAGYNALLDTH
jgi:hypothetical protein